MPNNFEPLVGHEFQFRTKTRGWVRRNRQLRRARRAAAAPARLGTRLPLDHTGFRGLFVSMILGKGRGSKILFLNLPALLDRWDGIGPVPAVPEADCHR
jgi:hypothetical protein